MADEGGAAEGAAGASAAEGGAGGAAEGGEGTATGGWIGEGVTAEQTAYAAAQGFNNPLEILTAHQQIESRYKNLESIQRHPPDRTLMLPEDLNSPEAMEPIFTRLGRPEKAEDYDLTTLGIPEGEDVLLPWFKAEAHKAGLDQGRALGLAKSFMDWQNTQVTTQTEKAAETEALALANYKDALRAQGQTYEAAELLARQGAGVLGLEDNPAGHATIDKFAEVFGESRMVELLANIGRALGEAGSPGGGGGDPALPSTAQTAQAKMTELKTDAEFMKSVTDIGHPQHNANKQRWETLTEMAFKHLDDVKPIGA